MNTKLGVSVLYFDFKFVWDLFPHWSLNVDNFMLNEPSSGMNQRNPETLVLELSLSNPLCLTES